MTNRWNTIFYTGSTSDIVRRVAEHKAGEIGGFTKKYNLNKLVWFEVQDDMDCALLREDRIKHWIAKWKVALIEASNPDWLDVYEKAKISMAHSSDY